MPDHSFFFFGPTLAPQDAELIAGGMSASTSLFAPAPFIGSVETGWKVALCQRDVAIYAGVLVGGLLYGLVRDRLRPLPFKVFVVLCIPIAVDGLTQLFGWRESNWLLRTLTGALFGFAAVWLAYPYVEEAMAEVIEGETARRSGFHEGRKLHEDAEKDAQRGEVISLCSSCICVFCVFFFLLLQLDMPPFLPYTTILLSEGQSSQCCLLQHIQLGASTRAQPAW